MNILFLTQIIPYPPDAGPKVKTWHVLRYLSGLGHKIILASFVRPDEEPYVEYLRQICSQVYTIPIHRSRIADVGYWVRSNFSGRPFLIERDDLLEMRNLVHKLMVEHSIDIIHADQLTMTQFALPEWMNKHIGNFTSDRDFQKASDPWPALVFDAHNAVWTIVKRMVENAPFYLKPVLNIEAIRIKKYEASILNLFDQTLAVAEPDRDSLIKAITHGNNSTSDLNEKISVIPIAVDTVQLQPIKRQPGSFNIVTLGTLHYPPNADGIRWFMNDVFPFVREKIPEATLTIIGKNPPNDFAQAAEKAPKSIEVTGYVTDLEPYMAKAAMMVVPVRAGGGIRVRILDGFARAMPMVTTTVGLEGIEAVSGQEILVADTANEFASTVVDLLNDTDLQNRLAQNGRKLAEEKYDWQVVLKKLDQIYENVVDHKLGLGHFEKVQ